MSKHLGWVIKPKITPFVVILSNTTIMCSSGTTNGLVSSGTWLMLYY